MLDGTLPVEYAHCDVVHVTTKWVSRLVLNRSDRDVAIKAYSMAIGMQREREAIDVGALTNMAAGESVVTRNVSVPVA